MKNMFETYASFYKSRQDMLQALFIAVDALKTIKDTPALPLQEGNLVKISDLINYIVTSDTRLSYIDRDHIIELFFKDRERRLLIVDKDYIQYRFVTYVQPPETLYFGTVKNLAERMMNSGLKSKTKGFIKLYSSIEAAKQFARQFATRDGDVLVALTVDASTAFAEGTKFSTHKEGEYIAVRIDPINIKGMVE